MLSVNAFLRINFDAIHQSIAFHEENYTINFSIICSYQFL